MKINKLKELETKLLKYGFKKISDNIFDIDYELIRYNIIFQIVVKKRDNILWIRIRQIADTIVSKTYYLNTMTDVEFIQLISRINIFKTLLFDLFCDK